MKKISILLCILWLGFIFYMSNSNGTISHQASNKLANLVKNTETKLQNKIEDDNLQINEGTSKKENNLDNVVRKNAHAFMYMMLAILVSNLFFAYNKKGKNAIVYILFICLLYAITDEFHQSFVPGRSSLVSDVLIDFSGSLIGLAFYYLAYYKIYRRNDITEKQLS